MGKNLVRKTYTADGTWTAPAGVNWVTISAYDSFGNISVGVDNTGFLNQHNGALITYGRNQNGQLGAATSTAGRSSALAVSSTATWKKISYGLDYALAITLNVGSGLLNNTVSFGVNASGQLGDASVTARSQLTAFAALYNFKDVAAGNAQSVGIATDGDAYAWGINTNGNLGLGDVTPRSTPVVILRALDWRQIAVSGSTNLFMSGVTTARDAYGWGVNANGQLGVGDVTPRSSPVLVLRSKQWDMLACGDAFTVGLDTAGALYAWGLNTNGQLGLGDVTPRSSPVIVLGGKTWTHVAAGASHVIAIDNAGEAYAWGLNANGQLGLGDVTPRSSPVIVLGGKTWADIGAGGANSGGITLDGEVYGWGVNTYGELGVGNQVPRSSPVIVLGVGNLYNGRSETSVLTKEIKLTVVPGTSYTIKYVGKMVLFGLTPIVSSLRCKELVLEYFT